MKKGMKRSNLLPPGLYKIGYDGKILEGKFKGLKVTESVEESVKRMTKGFRDFSWQLVVTE